MDIRKVKKLMELLEESGMAEIEIKEGEESVKISRFGASPAPLQSPVQSFIQQQPVVNSAPVATTSAEPADGVPAPEHSRRVHYHSLCGQRRGHEGLPSRPRG